MTSDNGLYYSAKEIRWGLGQIASATGCLRPAMKQSAHIIAMSNNNVARSNYAIADKIGEVANSGREIAKAIFNTSSVMNESLAEIADELERKRKTEEYYRLLSLIDSLENKIINLNGDVKSIYDKLPLNYNKPIKLTIQEMQLITRMCSEETLEWVCKTSIIRGMNPMDLIYELLTKSKFIFVPKGESYTYIDRIIAIPLTYDRECANWKLVIDTYKTHDEDAICFKYGGEFSVIKKGKKEEYEFCWNEEKIPIMLVDIPERKKYIGIYKLAHGDRLLCTDGQKARIIEYILQYLSTKEYLKTEEIDKISSFQAFVSQLNCDIILGNLRNLHTELLNAYKELKLK